MTCFNKSRNKEKWDQHTHAHTHTQAHKIKLQFIKYCFIQYFCSFSENDDDNGECNQFLYKRLSFCSLKTHTQIINQSLSSSPF